MVHKKGLVKTVAFKESKYVGDPINAVKIFNEKEVDELIVLDIDASVEGRPPDFDLIRNIAIECRMPFCYGGGIRTVEVAKKIIHLGAEKVALSSAAIADPGILQKIGKSVGVQSVVVVLDVKKVNSSNEYEIFVNNGRSATGIRLMDFVAKIDNIGVGEIVINSIDRDGKMEGYDLALIDIVRQITDIPVTVLGGAGKVEDIKSVIAKYKVIGVAAVSLFVFKGKFRAVLINYPNRAEKKAIYQS